MEEMVTPLLPFLIYYAYLRNRKEVYPSNTNVIMRRMILFRSYDKKCENTAHIERGLLNNSYLCDVVQ